MNLYTVAKLNRLCRKYDLGRLIAQVTYESGMECRLSTNPTPMILTVQIERIDHE